MKTLVIVNSSEEELSDFKEKFADELKRDDVIFIENPKDKTDLEKRLESHRGEFDRVVIIAHGNKDEIPIINVFGKDNVAITDVIKTVNKGNEETLKKIHLTSCHIGSNFNRIEQKDSSSDYYLKLDESLQDGQILFLHGDSYASDSELSLDKRLKGIVESQNYSISEAVLDSTEGISVAVKKHRNPIENSSLETFSYQSFGRKYEEFSTAYLKPYLNEMVTKARNFEKACGILNGDVSEQRLKNLSEENYQQYLSDNFIMEVTKFNDNKLIVRAASLFRRATDINLANRYGLTALMIAVATGQTEVAKLLLENKTIDPNLADKNGFTALLLLKNKTINPNLADKNGFTALMFAADKGQTKAAKLLLEDERVKPNLANKDGWTALMIAIEKGQTKVAKLLLEDKRVNLNLADKDGWTALMIAIEKGQTEVAKLLLENKTINPNLADKNGFTALMFAADKSNVEIVEYLIKKGADPEIKDPNGSAPSYFAGGKNKDKIIELLSQAIKKKQQDSILKEWKSAFSAKEIEEMQCNPSNFFSDSSGQKINQCAFEELQQKYLANLGSKESGQDFSTKNLILREDKSLSSKIEELREHNSPSSTITDGSKLLFGVTAGVAAKLVAKKFTTEEKQKKNLGTVR